MRISNHHDQMRILLICIILACSVKVSLAQTLWQEAKVGMTIDQVKAAYPSAISPTDPEILEGGKSVEKLRIPSFEVGSDVYKVVFHFGGDRLQMIKLEPTTQLSLAAAEFRVSTLLPLLRARYGQELSGNRQKLGPITMIEYMWIQGKTRVKMNVFGGPPSALFNVVYTGDGAEAANKL